MTKTTNTTRIAVLEEKVAGQAETIEFLLERIERLTDRVNFVKKWNREQDQAIGEMPERAARHLRATHDHACLQRAADAGHIPATYA